MKFISQTPKEAGNHENHIQYCIQKDTVQNIYKCLKKGNNRIKDIESSQNDMKNDIRDIKETLNIKGQRINSIGRATEKADDKLEQRVKRIEEWIFKLLILMIGSLLTAITALGIALIKIL